MLCTCGRVGNRRGADKPTWAAVALQEQCNGGTLPLLDAIGVGWDLLGDSADPPLHSPLFSALNPSSVFSHISWILEPVVRGCWTRRCQGNSSPPPEVNRERDFTVQGVSQFLTPVLHHLCHPG